MVDLIVRALPLIFGAIDAEWAAWRCTGHVTVGSEQADILKEREAFTVEVTRVSAYRSVMLRTLAEVRALCATGRPARFLAVLRGWSTP